MTRRPILSTLLAISALLALKWPQSIEIAGGLCGAQRAFGASLKASNPKPADGAQNLTSPLLQWTAGDTAKWHDVYFGTNPTPGAAEFRGRQAFNLYWHAPGFTPAATYYWRIDEVEANGTTIHKGDVWSFTTTPGAANRTASNPNPGDGATCVDTQTDLSWSPGLDAVSHDVYLGTDKTNVANGTGETFRGNQKATNYGPGSLNKGTTYYWRIDEVEADGTTKHKGSVWSFTTIPPEVVKLEVTGPNEAPEESGAQYAALAYYEDDSIKDVTTLTIWSIEPNTSGSINESGFLTLTPLDTPVEATINAEYTECQATVKGRKLVFCLPYPRPPLKYYVDVVNGDDNNHGLTREAAFATIQKAINTAHDKDTVLVYPGVYTEGIRFLGKAITVCSAADAAILQNPDNFAVSFYYGEGPGSVLKNLVIRNSPTGIFCTASSPTIRNVTVVNNKYGIEAHAGSEPNVSSSIFWYNSNADLLGCLARYSCIERGGEGPGNLSLDPMFADPEKADYHLKSERGRYWPEHDVWVLDKVTSPCIDAGDPTADYSGEPKPNGDRINMGAYGGTPYASMSERPFEGDVNGDGIIDIADLITLIEKWLQSVGWVE
jgi:hypothetical protein